MCDFLTNGETCKDNVSFEQNYISASIMRLRDSRDYYLSVVWRYYKMPDGILK